MDQTLYLTVGLPGAGKTTWSKAKAQKDDRTLIISRDAVRSMLKGKFVYDPLYEGVVKEVVVSTLESALTRGFSVILDEMNIWAVLRERWVTDAKRIQPDLKIVFVVFKERLVNVERRMQDDPRGLTKEEWLDIFNKFVDQYEDIQEEELRLIDEIIQIQAFEGV